MDLLTHTESYSTVSDSGLLLGDVRSSLFFIAKRRIGFVLLIVYI